jgi:CBS domain-containing protein
MKLREITTSHVEVIHPDESLQTAAHKMPDRDIGCLPVPDGDDSCHLLL